MYSHALPSFQSVITANVVLSIMLKFTSVVCLRIALEEYENLSSNANYLSSSLLASLCTNCLMAPVFTYDHVNCMPRNFIIGQNSAERLSVAGLVLTVIPLFVYLILPGSLRRLSCCSRIFNR